MTLEAWRNLSEDDRFEYLAYDRNYQDRIEKLVKPYWDKVAEEAPVNSVEVFYSLILAGL